MNGDPPCLPLDANATGITLGGRNERGTASGSPRHSLRWTPRSWLTVMSAPTLAGQDVPVRLGVPAYGYPGETDMWSELVLAPAGSVVILDPADGPGAAPDPVYERVVTEIHNAGVVVYGYVDTNYGTRSTEAILADARDHVDWYAVDGIFLDQTPGGLELALFDAVKLLKAQGLAVTMNPGQPVIANAYVEWADHVVVFEGSRESYGRFHLPAWMRAFPADKFWHLVYDVPDGAQAQAVMRRAAKLGAGLVYVTDGTMPNPWRVLPRYWAEEVATIRNSSGTSSSSSSVTPVPATTAS